MLVIQKKIPELNRRCEERGLRQFGRALSRLATEGVGTLGSINEPQNLSRVVGSGVECPLLPLGGSGRSEIVLSHPKSWLALTTP